MSEPLAVAIFAENRAHEEFLKPLVARIAREESVRLTLRLRSARGGASRATEEFKLYQQLVEKGAAGVLPLDLLIVAIDGNCTAFAAKTAQIRRAALEPFSARLVIACPAPHVESWYLADPESFRDVVGTYPRVGRRKCARDHYKRALAQAVRQAGHPATLGGIEFAQELVGAMDFYRAGKRARSLQAFADDLRGRFRQLRSK